MAELSNKNDIIVMMDDWFGKLPPLPTNIREVIVRITPWIALVFGVLGILAGLGAVGVSPVVLFGGIRSSMLVLVSGLLTIASSAMLLAAYPKTKAHKKQGWNLLFWSTVVSLVSSIVAGGLVSAIIWGLVEFYLLFQIKSYYK
ncbi:MAG: hypothetical protein HZC02_03030 [Candidatus Levybacteria bacterium]|nr:hypothetical protein [Candidatus Levybacteria bacterium]